MVGLREFGGAMLEWKQLGWGNSHYQLFGDGQLLGTLDWTWSLGGGTAEGRFDGETVSFKRVGFIKQEVRVTSGAFGQDILTASLGSRDSRVMFNDGMSYTVSRTSWGGRQWQITDHNGAPVMTIAVNMGLARNDGIMSIVKGQERNPHLPMLVMLSWFIIVTKMRDTAVAAGA